MPGRGYVGDIAIEIPIAAVRNCELISDENSQIKIHRISVDPNAEVRIVFTAEKLSTIILSEIPFMRSWTRYDYMVSINDQIGSMYVHPLRSDESHSETKGQKYGYTGSSMQLRGYAELTKW